MERLEREALTLKKVTDSSFPLQESIADERNRRESMLGHLRDEIDQADEMRNKPDKVRSRSTPPHCAYPLSASPPLLPSQIFKDDLITRMVRATKDIKLETSVRVAAEQQFVSSLESYTKALQEGLRMVNKQVDEEGARR